VARPDSLRASDSDREHVVDRLRLATAEGRLRAEELEERLTTALAARTYGELDRVLADLPAALPERRRSRGRRPGPALAAAATVTVGVVLTVFAILAAGTSLRVQPSGRPVHGRSEVFHLVSRHGFFPVIAGPVLGMLAVVVLCVAVSWLFVSARSPAQPSH
jgi:hypothetical protein